MLYFSAGQKIAARISKQLQRNSVKLQKSIEKLKDAGVAVPETQDDLAVDYLLPDLNRETVQAANAAAELERAVEEEKRVLDDVSLFHQWLSDQNQCLRLTEDPLQSTFVHLRAISKLKAEKMLKSVHCMFGSEVALQENDDNFFSKLFESSSSYDFIDNNAVVYLSDSSVNSDSEPDLNDDD